ncbi:MAG: hypothetical protein H2060_01945 [Azoarcus sp.]|nr:hypothetical protein [Azoarcus sp.]
MRTRSAPYGAASPVITGLGVWGGGLSGREALAAALREDRGAVFEALELPPLDEAVPMVALGDPAADIARWLEALDADAARAAHRALRRAPASAQATLLAALDAWSQAGAPGRDCALVASAQHAGAAELLRAQPAFLADPAFVDPALMLVAQDSYAVSLVSELLGLRGAAAVVGAAQAGGLFALIDAARLLCTGEADAVLVLGVPSLPGALEAGAYRALGALADGTSDGEAGSVPFDAASTGFVPAGLAAALVLERADAASARGATPLAYLAGWATRMHASAQPSPDIDAEGVVMRGALDMAGLAPERVALVSAHATGTPLGDRVEAEAIAALFDARPWVNAPKSLFGHALSAAGVFETVCCVLQMVTGHAHGNRGLTRPQVDGPRYVPAGGVDVALPAVLKTAFGFGGFNAAVALTEAGV